LKLLALSTAEQGSSLAIIDGDRLVCDEYWDARQTHSTRLLTMVEQMIEKRSGMALADIDAFIAAKGPGSFTGLRIGISVIKGLAYATQKPAMGASSLDGIAFRFLYANMPVCVMMDAKRNEVYSALYSFENGRLVSKSKEMVGDPEKIMANIDEPTVFVGSGSKAYQSLIGKKMDHPFIASSFQDSVSAVALVQSLGLDGKILNFSNHPLEPVYLRKSDAELNFLKPKKS